MECHCCGLRFFKKKKKKKKEKKQRERVTKRELAEEVLPFYVESLTPDVKASVFKPWEKKNNQKREGCQDCSTKMHTRNAKDILSTGQHTFGLRITDT